MKVIAYLVALATAGMAVGCEQAGNGADVEGPSPPTTAAAPHPGEADHRFCGWLYGSRNPVTLNTAYDTFAAHADAYDAVHPTWWHVTSPTTIEARAFGFEDARVMSNTTPGGKRTKLVPTIQAEDAPDRDHAHAILNDPALRARHVADIVQLVTSHRYDGIDLDYEHLNATLEPGQTIATERAAFSAFVAELSCALHAAGKTLSLAIPAEESDGGIYDYDALSASADQVHVMGYDWHYESGAHAGPVAPLGWIRGVVRYIGSLDGGRRRGRFILGVPNYGLHGPGAQLCATSMRCLEMAGDDYRTTTHHMDAEGVDPGRSPNQTLADGSELFFDDLLSLEEKVETAAEGGLGGVGYWSIGGEPDRPGDRTFWEMVRAHFPRGE